MGVKDLWKILKPTARPVNPESLHDVILGVGELYTCTNNSTVLYHTVQCRNNYNAHITHVSIWFNQAIMLYIKYIVHYFHNYIKMIIIINNYTV